jgi:hypothetical protein
VWRYTYGILYKVRRSGGCSYDAVHVQNMASLKLAVFTVMRFVVIHVHYTSDMSRNYVCFCHATNGKAPNSLGVCIHLFSNISIYTGG